MDDRGQYFLGLDGGGTGCRARLADSAGHMCGTGSAGPATLRLGEDVAWAALMAAARAAIVAAGLEAVMHTIHACAGVAGLSRAGAHAALSAHSHPFAALSFVSDGMTACLGAHAGADGGIVIAGTGSVALALHQGAEIRMGGYGLPVSDEGSGSAMGVAAVRTALQALDGRVARTALLEAVLAHFSHQAASAVAWMDGASGTDYARFAPLVLDHARQGDAAAIAIVREAAAELSALVRALAARGIGSIAILGGLAQPITPWLDDDVRTLLVTPKGDALDGALLLARRNAGL